MKKASLKERFEEKYIPEPMSGCWLWVGATGPNGYGHMGFNGKYLSSHRVSFELFKGAIPKNICVLHKCDNKACVNPDHLFIGTHKDNYEDMVKKDRRVTSKGKDSYFGKNTHCKNGHEYNSINTWFNKKTNNQRKCRICDKLRKRLLFSKSKISRQCL